MNTLLSNLSGYKRLTSRIGIRQARYLPEDLGILSSSVQVPMVPQSHGVVPTYGIQAMSSMLILLKH